jgi:hypothetical protein
MTITDMIAIGTHGTRAVARDGARGAATPWRTTGTALTGDNEGHHDGHPSVSFDARIDDA